MFKICTLCLKGYESAVKRGLHEFIKKENLDLISLQDLKVNKEKFKIKSILKGYEKLYHNKYLGVIFKKKLKFKKRLASEKYFVIIEFDKFILIDLYAKPSSFSMRYLSKLVNYVNELKDRNKPMILTGDFNSAVPCNRRKSFIRWKHANWIVEEIVIRTEFLDIWNFLSKFNVTKSDFKKDWVFPYTYIHNIARDEYWYLNDHIFLSKRLASKIEYFYVKVTNISDHMPVTVVLKTI